MRLPTAVALSIGAGLGFLLSSGLQLATKGPSAANPFSGGTHPSTTIQPGQSGTSSTPSLPLDDPRISLRELKHLGEKRALTDPRSAVRQADSIPGHDNREAFLSSVLYTWGETAGEEAAQWVSENFSGSKLSDALYFVADGWAESDPGAAAQWFSENSAGTIRDDAIWEALESWGRKDPASAWEWSKTLDDYTRFSVMDGLAEGWAAVDPVAAAEAALDTIGSDHDYHFLNAVAQHWAAQDPIAAAEWAGSILQENLREGVFLELGETWAQSDPLAAVEWVAGVEDEANRFYAQNGIAIGWSEYDPARAIEWTLGLTENLGQIEEMVGDIIFNWSKDDPKGTTRWLQEAPTGEKRDIVLRHFSESVFHFDPEAAVTWAAQISESEDRGARVNQLLSEWVALEGPSALTSIRKLPLPDRLGEKFLDQWNQ